MANRAALAGLLNRPLAFSRDALDAALAALESGADLTGLQAARRGGGAGPGATTLGVLPIIGAIVNRPTMLGAFFGGETPIGAVRHELAKLLDDPRVSTIVLLCDTPGGDVAGVPELAYELREARTRKPLVAIVDTLAASAGYWLAAQADEIILTTSSTVGSVGVYWLHLDASQALDKAGIRPTFVSAGPHKTEGNGLQPLSTEAAAHVQGEVDRVYRQFISDIVAGRGRGLTAARVRESFGQGRLVSASDAIRAGMADRLVPTPGAAFSQAATVGERARLVAEHDRIDLTILASGPKAAQDAAFARLMARPRRPSDVEPHTIAGEAEAIAIALSADHLRR